jgi:RNA polymerase sigma-70 factor (family 1)
MKHHTDNQLLQQLATGSHTAFETIYRRYASQLYGYARKNLQHKEDCEELIQEVFESLWLRRENLNIRDLRHYLFNSVRYIIIRHFYNKGVKKRYLEHYRIFAEWFETANDHDHEPQSISEKLIASLSGLPARCRQAMQLRILENLSNSEIAQRMNISKRTVELYMSKALIHLRTHHKILH